MIECWVLLGTLFLCGPNPQDDILDDLDDLVLDVEEEEVFDDLDAILDDDLDAILEGDSSEDPEAQASALKGIKGFFEIRPRIYFQDRDDGKNNQQLLFESEFELDFEFRDNLDGYFRPRIFVDGLDGGLERFEPFEGYLTLEGDGFDVRAGQMVENWGIVDTFNPIDVINRRDIATDILDAERLGELGVRGRIFLSGGDVIGEPTISAYVLPVWRETLFAPEDQRFSFDSEGIEFDPDRGFEPSGEERAFAAVRFASTVNTAPVNADLQVLVARGPERFPAILPLSPTTLAPAYFGAWTYGVGFRAVPNQDVAGEFLSSLTWKLEVVYKTPYEFDDSPIDEPDSYVAYVVGVDRQFYDVISDQDQLTATIEYAREEGQARDPTAVLRPFRDDIIFRFLWEPNDFARSSLELRGIYDFDHGETIFELVFERQLRFIDEDLKFISQVQFFNPPGDDESLFDFFPNNSSAAIGVRWDF